MHKGLLLCSAALGVLVGVGGVTFVYAEGASYLSTDPRACANCHIMQRQYDSWQKASHHTVATCVDCHLPHDFVPKYVAKAEHGWNHSVAFTLQNFKEPIEMTPRSAAQLRGSCVSCHARLVHAQRASDSENETFDCLRCHADVGHGESTGLGGPFDESEVSE